MVRPLIGGLCLALLLALPARGAEPIDRLPYRIEARVAFGPDVRLDARGREALLSGWKALARRFVGAPWELSIAEDSGAVSLESVDAEALKGRAEDRDQVWLIRLDRPAPDAGLEFSGRAYDAATRRLGPVVRRPAPRLADLPRELLLFAVDLFAPSAALGEPSGGGVRLTVRGAALVPASPLGRVVAAGSVFEPVRLVARPDGTVRALAIPFTYLRIEATEGVPDRAAIVSALRDPLTRRMVGKSTLLAHGVKPGREPTRLRFVDRADQSPAAGYALSGRPVPEGAPRDLGTTDRDGRIVLEPGFADSLLVLRLLAGRVEPLVEFPLMPGASDRERLIPIETRPRTVALETALDALRDEIIDLIAVRARLEARLKARLEGEDWPGFEAIRQEFARLPAREVFATRLSALRAGAAREQAKSKTAILTRTAQAELTDVQSLIDRYLDDETIKTLAEAAERGKLEAVARKKAPRRP